jgi:hypothetical protein
MDRTDLRTPADSSSETGEPTVWTPSEDPSAPTRFEEMPREIGVLLLATGMITGMLPPPPGPFDLSLMAAGGVALWPRGFRAVEGIMRGYFPRAHRAGMVFLERYLDDLERRYPGSTNAAEYERKVITRMLGGLLQAEQGAATPCEARPRESDEGMRPDRAGCPDGGRG